MINKSDKYHLNWIFSGYFAMGLVSSLTGNVSAVFLKNLGVSNAVAAFYASCFLLAYSIKPFFSAFVEIYKNNKLFIVYTQIVLSFLFVLLSLVVFNGMHLHVFIALFLIISFAGALQDIATDGHYVTSLNVNQQSKLCGFQSLAWNVGPIVAVGFLVSLSGYLHEFVFNHDSIISGVDWLESWGVIFFILGVIMLLIAIYHYGFMPSGLPLDHQFNRRENIYFFWCDSFLDFFRKRDIWIMIALVFTYRLSAGFLDKITSFFLIDSVDVGGLGLTNKELGSILGTYGIFSFLMGSLVGGWFVAKRGVMACLFFLCCCVNFPNIFFVFLAVFQPNDFWVINASIAIEKFLLGFGAVGHMIYMMQYLAPGRYTVTHYAFGTGILSLCFMLTGAISGYLQESLGYINFFIFVMFVGLFSLFICWLVQFRHADIKFPNNSCEANH